MSGDNNTNQYKGSSDVQSDLDKILDRLESNGVIDSNLEDQVFAKSHKDLNNSSVSVELKKEKILKDLSWYLKLIKIPVLILSGLNIVAYVGGAIVGMEEEVVSVADPFFLVASFVVAGFIAYRIKRRERETFTQAVIATFLAGFGWGFVMSIFKVFWIRELWTILNIIIESVFMGFVLGAIGVLVGGLVARRRI